MVRIFVVSMPPLIGGVGSARLQKDHVIATRAQHLSTFAFDCELVVLEHARTRPK